MAFKYPRQLQIHTCVLFIKVIFDLLTLVQHFKSIFKQWKMGYK